jgi:hypothetical protein
MRQITVVYNIVDETTWAKVNPLTYKHDGLEAVRAAVGNRLADLDELGRLVLNIGKKLDDCNIIIQDGGAL